MSIHPNVRPGALSGTMQPFGADPLPDETVETATQGGLMVPAGDLDARLAWVAEPDDDGERRRRADAVWQHEVDTGTPQHELDELADRLTDIMYDGTEVPADGTERELIGEEGPELVNLPSGTQVAAPAGIESTTTTGAQPDENPASDGSADPGATGEPPAPSEAESGGDSVHSDANTADDTGQNNTSSP